MNRQFIAAAILAMSAGVAYGDLASDLTRMPANEALFTAVQTQGLPVGQVVASAVAELGDNSELVYLLVSTAVMEYPDQAVQIVYDATIAAPAMWPYIESAALAQLENNPDAQQAVTQSTQFALAEAGAEDLVDTEVVAESAEAPAPVAAIPPPPPPSFNGSGDRPVGVSPTT